jgi:hypothetical protein
MDYERGQWHSIDRMLAYLNTLEDRYIDKHTIYGYLMQMRPELDYKKERQVNCPIL